MPPQADKMLLSLRCSEAVDLYTPLDCSYQTMAASCRCASRVAHPPCPLLTTNTLSTVAPVRKPCTARAHLRPVGGLVLGSGTSFTEMACAKTRRRRSPNHPRLQLCVLYLRLGVSVAQMSLGLRRTCIKQARAEGSQYVKCEARGFRVWPAVCGMRPMVARTERAKAPARLNRHAT
jgi:hypothetical protein